MNRFLHLFLVPFFALAVAACDSDEECGDDADCPSGRICSGDRCIPQAGSCNSDQDCTGTQVCNPTTSRCEAPGNIDPGNPVDRDTGVADTGGEEDVPVNNDQPRVVETVPADGTRGVSAGNDFQMIVRFSERLQERKVEAGFTLTELGGERIDVLVTYDEASLTATVKPDTPLKAYGIYALEADTEITDFDDPPKGLAEHVTRFSVGPVAEAEAANKAKAMEFAPDIYLDHHNAQSRRDFFTNYDFDGVWKGEEKRDAAVRSGAELTATVYQSVVSTRTHDFIRYVIYHPFDYADENVNDVQRENTMSGATVIVGRRGDAAGKIRLIETYSHQGQALFAYTPAESGVTRSGVGPGDRDLTSMPADWLTDGKRYHAYITEGRHDSCVWEHEVSGFGALPCRHEASTFRGDPRTGGMKLVVGAEGEIPSNRDDEGCNDCTAGQRCQDGACKTFVYELKSLEEDVWVRREQFADEAIWTDDVFSYQPAEGRPDTQARLPSAFVGNEGEADPGQPPWAWEDPEHEGLPRGAYFIDPAYTFGERYDFPEGEDFSLDYCWNPYLGIDKRSEASCQD